MSLWHRWRVPALAVIAILLGVLLATAIAAIGVLAKQLAQAQSEVLELKDALDAAERGAPRPSGRTLQAAGAAGSVGLSQPDVPLRRSDLRELHDGLDVVRLTLQCPHELIDRLATRDQLREPCRIRV